MRDEAFCFWHSPEHTEEVAEARRLGGLRRRREKTLQGVYDLVSLETMEGIRRIVEIATFDTLGLESSIPRSRTLIAAALAAVRLKEVGDLVARVAALEAAHTATHVPDPLVTG